MAIRIITDSTADFTRDEAAQLGIEIVPLKTRFGDEEYIDGVTISPREFYEKLVESDVMPSTSQPSPAEFEATYDKVLAGGDEAVVITISGELSGTYQSAVIAAEKYPGRIAVVDSRSASIGAQILVRRAVQLAESAPGAAELARVLLEERGRVCVIALLDTLEYLKRGGRISSAVAFAGGVLAIKPVVTIKDGIVQLVGRARGSKTATTSSPNSSTSAAAWTSTCRTPWAIPVSPMRCSRNMYTTARTSGRSTPSPFPSASSAPSSARTAAPAPWPLPFSSAPERISAAPVFGLRGPFSSVIL